MAYNPFGTLRSFTYGSGKSGTYHSLPALEEAGIGPVSKLPVSIRIVLESVLRNCDGKRVAEADVHTLANWGATAERTDEVPFVVARVVLQDFTGVPLLVDMAAMRSAVDKLGKNAGIIEPLVPLTSSWTTRFKSMSQSALKPSAATWKSNSSVIHNAISS